MSRRAGREAIAGCLLASIGMAALVGAVFAGTAAPAGAQEKTGYQRPPEPIAKLIDAPASPWVSVGPRNEWLLLANRPPLPSIEEVAQPEERLAGIRVNPRTNGPSRTAYSDGLVLLRIDDQLERPITGLPENPKINRFAWSPDGTWIAFLVTDQEGLSLWAANVADGKARCIVGGRLNAALGRPYAWLADSKTFVVRLVPEDRGPVPPEPIVPAGPIIQESVARKAPARTYQDMLTNEHDEALFEYYMTSQIATATLDGTIKAIGEPGIHATCEPAPGGEYMLVETIHRPFSYTVPHYRFPRRVEVWDLEGRLVKPIADLPLADDVPIAYGSVPTGPRSFDWRADAPATLCWTEALDGGDGGSEAEERDQVYLWEGPFRGEPVPWFTAGQRFDDITWCQGDFALAATWWWQTRNIKVWRLQPDHPGAEPELVQDRSWEDRYNDPGEPVMTHNEYGEEVILTSVDGQKIYMIGDGASGEGDRPFLDEVLLGTWESSRLFQSKAPYYEQPVTVIDPQRPSFLIRRESVTTPPNYYVLNLATDDLSAITDFPNPTPELMGVEKELIHYTRDDGVDLTATLYLPPDYDPDADDPLPMLMWAYPQEFKSADAAGQVQGSPYRFVRVGWWSPMLYLVHGYAVLDDPAMPIVGEGEEEPNDTFIEQLVASAEAAVEEVVRRGVADRDRIAIGGHSYGAFMTAHLLAHSDLFRLGLARSGAYNRTLTPFGFQSDERSLWRASETYWTLSPFMHADKIDEPVLLVHGQADNNTGTYPEQSERFYDALKGLGATVRLVMLPHESHSYRAEESVMHVVAETVEWLDRYVKEAGPREK